VASGSGVTGRAAGSAAGAGPGGGSGGRAQKGDCGHQAPGQSATMAAINLASMCCMAACLSDVPTAPRPAWLMTHHDVGGHKARGLLTIP